MQERNVATVNSELPPRLHGRELAVLTARSIVGAAALVACAPLFAASVGGPGEPRAAVNARASSAESSGMERASDDRGDFSFGTAFTYRGSLREAGRAATGRYDVGFELWDARQGGEFLGRVEIPDLEVKDGEIVAPLDFGIDVFAGDAPYVQLHLRRADSNGPYTPLEPRRRVAGVRGVCTINTDVAIEGALHLDPPGSATGLTVACCNDVDDGGQLALTGFLGETLLDANEIQATDVGGPAPLLLNPQGGNVGVGVDTTVAPLSLPAGPDVTPGSGGSLVLGTAANGLALDANEIMRRTSGSPGILFLNFDGGNVKLGGDLDIGIERISFTTGSTLVEASCPANKFLLSGGCSTPAQVVNSYPVDQDTWRCEFDGNHLDNTAVAVCGRLRWTP